MKSTHPIYRDRRGEYRWRLRAINGEIIADSNEGYSRKSDCEHGIDLLIRSERLHPLADQE